MTPCCRRSPHNIGSVADLAFAQIESHCSGPKPHHHTSCVLHGAASRAEASGAHRKHLRCGSCDFGCGFLSDGPKTRAGLWCCVVQGQIVLCGGCRTCAFMGLSSYYTPHGAKAGCAGSALHVL